MVEVGRRFDRLPDGDGARCRGRGLSLVELQPRDALRRDHRAGARADRRRPARRAAASDEVHATFTELTVEGAAAHRDRAAGGPDGAARPSCWRTSPTRCWPSTPPGPMLAARARRLGGPQPRRAAAGRAPAYDAAAAGCSRPSGPAARTGAGWCCVDRGAALSRATSMLLERAAATRGALPPRRARPRVARAADPPHRCSPALIAGSVPLAETAVRGAGRSACRSRAGRCVAVLVRLEGGRAGPALEAQERLRDFAETVSAAVRDTRAAALVGGVDDAHRRACCSRCLPARTSTARSSGSSAALAKRAATGRAPVGRRRGVWPWARWCAACATCAGAFLEAAQVADAAPRATTAGAPYYRLPDVAAARPAAPAARRRPPADLRRARARAAAGPRRAAGLRPRRRAADLPRPPAATSRPPPTPRTCRGRRSTSGCTGSSGCSPSTSTRSSRACRCTSPCSASTPSAAEPSRWLGPRAPSQAVSSRRRGPCRGRPSGARGTTRRTAPAMSPGRAGRSTGPAASSRTTAKSPPGVAWIHTASRVMPCRRREAACSSLRSPASRRASPRGRPMRRRAAAGRRSRRSGWRVRSALRVVIGTLLGDVGCRRSAAPCTVLRASGPRAHPRGIWDLSRMWAPIAPARRAPWPHGRLGRRPARRGGGAPRPRGLPYAQLHEELSRGSAGRSRSTRRAGTASTPTRGCSPRRTPWS